MFWRRCWITLISISGLFRQLIPCGGPAGLGWPGSCLWWPLLQSCAQIKVFVISLFFQIKWPQKWAIKPAPLTFFPSLKISPIGSYVDVEPESSNSSKLVVISKSEHFCRRTSCGRCNQELLLFTLNQSYHKWTQAPISWDHYKDILIYGRCLGHLAGVYGMAQLKMECIKKVRHCPLQTCCGLQFG